MTPMRHRLTSAPFILLLTIALVRAQAPGFLKITAVEGEGAFNDIRHKLSHPPLVRVVDESNNLVQGATVTFTFPFVGPRGTFDGGGLSATAVTDDKGLARCPAFVPNTEEGRYNFKVSASFNGKTGSLVISQSNTLAGGSSVGEKGTKSHKMAWILALVGAGAAVGAVAAMHGGSSSTPAAIPPTTLSIGAITVGTPH